MSAFESSPVHCLKPRPCGKRRRPAKAGTAAILYTTSSIDSTHDKMNHLPSIDIIHDALCIFLRVHLVEVLLNPINQVVFECPFDKLVKDIGGNEFVDVGASKIIRKGLI